MMSLSFENVSFYQRKSALPLIDRVSIDFSQGKLYLLLGNSAVERGILALLLSGIKAPSAGRIHFHNELLESQLIGSVFQAYNFMPRQSAIENLYLYTLAKRLDISKKECQDYLRKFGIDGQSAQQPMAISDKIHQAKYCLARATIGNPKLLIIDGLFSELDFLTQQMLMQFLTEMKEQVCIILLDNQQQLADDADEVWGLNRGRLTFIKESYPSL